MLLTNIIEGLMENCAEDFAVLILCVNPRFDFFDSLSSMVLNEGTDGAGA
jgi:hypothetical protein